MTIELTVAISLCCTVLGAVVGLAGYRHTAQRDAASEARSDAVIATELGYVKASVERLQRKQAQLEARLNELTVELTKLQASAPSPEKCAAAARTKEMP